MKLKEHRNPGKQGDAGLGVAIGWFASRGYTVCLPLTDHQEYDLVIETSEGFKKIQVKTGRYTRNGSTHPRIDLRTRSGRWSKVKYIDEKVDYLFVVTDASKYLIPVKDIQVKTELLLGDAHDMYKLGE